MPRKKIKVTKKEKQQEDKKFKNFISNNKKTFTIIGIVLGVILVAMFTIAVLSYSPAKETYEEAIWGKQKFEEAQEQITAQDFGAAKISLEGASQHFSDANTNFSKISWLKYTPILGKQIKAVENIIIAAVGISNALEKISDLGFEIFNVLEEDKKSSISSITPEQKKKVLKTIYESPPDVQGAKAELDLAVTQLEQIPDKGLLGPIADAIAPIKEKLPLVKQVIDKALPLIEIVPSIGGYPEEKTYLFLLQNNTELRPTGGFIGTYGILKIKNGEIEEFYTDNIYVIDSAAQEYLYIDPPEPFAEYLGVSQWLMRDSNYDPDFTISAQKAEEFYHLENGPETDIDGVISVTPVFIKSLLELTGPIDVEGEEFTAENFVDILQYKVEFGYVNEGKSDMERKEVIGTMSSILMDRITSLPKEQWGDLWESFTSNVDEKHILLYLKDEDVQRKITEMNWAGEMKSSPLDYLMVVDCNLAALKTDKVMERDIEYSVYKEGDDLMGEVKINYNNTGTFTNFTTRYRSYTRVYVPLGSELVEHEGVMKNDRLHGAAPEDPDVYE
ncbi:MAG: DUF4012 domain-containing protein, partial [Patescibacteria group bacterium]